MKALNFRGEAEVRRESRARAAQAAALFAYEAPAEASQGRGSAGRAGEKG